MPEFCLPATTANIDVLISRSIPWVLAAGSPYFLELFGGEEPAIRALQLWMRRPSSEVSIGRGQILMEGSDIAGGFIALAGPELKLARKADALALWKTVPASELRALIRRMANGANLFSPVADDEYYLSKLGLNEEFRGRGLGSALIMRYLQEGRMRGYSHYSLEVLSQNDPAVRLYKSAGFQIDRQLQSRDGRFRYFSMKLETSQ